MAAATDDAPFLRFFEKAISAELENMAALREKGDLFPTEDVGVAQGNSLSPLLGNIILADFDQQMNEGLCACIRYVDDFIIFGPSAKAVSRRLRKAQSLLSTLGMQLSPEKSSSGAVPVDDGFEFLGITVCPGLIRPSNRAQRTLLAKIEEILEDGKRALVELREAHHLQREKSLVAILRRVDSTITGWGKHYRFCNDGQVFDALDRRIWTCVRHYLGCYSDVRNDLGEELRPLALGIGQLRLFERVPLLYPKTPKGGP